MQGGERRRGCETVGMCVGVYICTFVGLVENAGWRENERL